MKRALTDTLVLGVLGTLALALASTADAAAPKTYEAPRAVRAGKASGEFAVKPSVKKAAGGWKIAFAVKAPTDVEVAVLDAGGKVVRHLAAGLLGEHAPAPLNPGSLRQELVWDGRDNAGKPVPAARVRVRLGMKTGLEKYLGRRDLDIEYGLRGLAVGPGGEVFVLLSHYHGKTEIRVLDRSGRYLRTIMPYPASTPSERAKPVGELKVDGQRFPIVFSGHSANLQPLTSTVRNQQVLFHPRGHLVMVSGLGHYAEHGPPQHLLAVHPRGGAPKETGFVGPRLRQPPGYLGGAGDRGAQSFSSVAASPDGKWLYVTHMVTGGRSSHKTRVHRDHHAVYRVKWGDEKLGKPFLGTGKAGKGEGSFNWPRGLATDPDGNLYVCDYNNDRVMVFSPAGKLLGRIPYRKPHEVIVHPRTREIYLLSRTGRNGWSWRGTLSKFSPFKDGKCKLLAKLKAEKPFAMALDTEADPPRLWVAMLITQILKGQGIKMNLVPVTDKGTQFAIGKPVNRGGGLPRPTHVLADPERNRVLVRRVLGGYRAFDLKTGRNAKLPKSLANSSQLALGPEGRFYKYGGWKSNVVLRYDAHGKPLPFKATGKNNVSVPAYVRGVSGIGLRGISVGPDGTLYAIANDKATRLMVYDADGKLKNAGLVTLGNGDCSVGADVAGNVYLGINVKPRQKPYQEGFEGVLPGAKGQGPVTWWWWPDAVKGSSASKQKRPAPWCYPYHNPYLFHWAAVFKFGPEGGRVLRGKGAAKAPAGAVKYSCGDLRGSAAVTGARWRYAGFGPCPMSGMPYGDPGCVCYNGRFKVDPYGRVFLPNAFRFCVEAIDAAGNRIARFGAYGNADSAGPKSREPKPEIAFGMPYCVDRDEERIYVSDILNDRIALIRLSWAAEESCAIR